MKNDFREFYDVDYILHSAFSDDELMHFGVEGMKWGVRRYQNPDGSLTPLGAQHYGKKLASLRNETKSNYSDYKAYAKKEIDYELKGKNTKRTKHLKDKYYNNYQRNMQRNIMMFGPLLSAIPSMVSDAKNNKYYDLSKGTITGQNMFITLKDGRVIPVDLGMLKGGIKYISNGASVSNNKDDFLEKEFKKRYKKK